MQRFILIFCSWSSWKLKSRMRRSMKDRRSQSVLAKSALSDSWLLICGEKRTTLAWNEWVVVKHFSLQSSRIAFQNVLNAPNLEKGHVYLMVQRKLWFSWSGHPWSFCSAPGNQSGWKPVSSFNISGLWPLWWRSLTDRIWIRTFELFLDKRARLESSCSWISMSLL